MEHTFARTEKPSAKGQPEWAAYTVQARATMEIDTDCKVVNDPSAGAETLGVAGPLEQPHSVNGVILVRASIRIEEDR